VGWAGCQECGGGTVNNQDAEIPTTAARCLAGGDEDRRAVLPLQHDAGRLRAAGDRQPARAGAAQAPPHLGPLTLGTAGHIDHGKTALVQALTGVDTDRLEEEKRRGISIALGYAPLALPSGRRLSVVDVPGHERFVRTMVAGATGIDLFLMVVAADDGVMPQTREHWAVLRGLGVTSGVVAVTKADLGPAPELGDLFGDCEVVPCSVRTGEGIEGLKAALDRVAAGVPVRPARGDVVLHVDRVFTVRGAGTVVTGTLWSGKVGEGDLVRVLPEGREVRVRSVEVHDSRVASAEAGQRVAMNLVGVGLDEVRRGDVIGGAALEASFVLDVALDVRVEHGTRVTVHHGTRETPARVAWLGGRFHQLRCEQPLIAGAGDRLIVRSIAPPDTLGGGVVLEPGAKKHGPSRDVLARLERLARGEPAPVGPAKRPQRSLSPPKVLDEGALALEERLRGAWPAVKDVDPEAFAALRAHGRAERVGPFALHADAVADVRTRVLAIIAAEGAITLARLRDELQTSRRYAQALLEHFDAARVTRRLPDDSRVASRRSGRS
jgi:selenocysteine-specific elongation factor